jgi:VWFA-related protein
MLALLLAATLITPSAIGLRVEIQPLGRGETGTVMGIAFQVAPEDRARIGERVQVEVRLVRGDKLLDRGGGVVALSPDGSGMLYREWPLGEAEARVSVASLDGRLTGGWTGKVDVTKQDTPFEAAPDAPSDAVALAASPAAPEAVHFLPPPREAGIGALELQVQAPSRTARMEFFQDGQALLQRQRPPWTVSVVLGQMPRRTVIKAVAYGGDGGYIGEDALVLNGPANQIPVEILLGPEPKDAAGSRQVTVSVGGSVPVQEVTLRLDDRPIARWLACPCLTQVPLEELHAAKLLAAAASGEGGTHGDAVKMLAGGGFVEEVRVDQVELPVVVLDHDGRPVNGLKRDAFKVFEDGKEMKVDSFGTTAELPLALGILVDISGSMEESYPDVRKAISGFSGALLRPGDRFFLMTFAWDAVLQVPWASDPRLVDLALERVKPEGGTSLHDAVVKALEQFRGQAGRKALVLLTDGDDTASRTNWDVALRFCRTVRTPIFPIGFRISRLDFFIRDHLKELASATGGQAFFTGKGEALAEVYRQISEQLRAQYLLSYRSPSTKSAEQFRSVKVDVSGEGLTARTIAGYYPGW